LSVLWFTASDLQTFLTRISQAGFIGKLKKIYVYCIYIENVKIM
jgi:hypothetical protein